MKCIGYWIAKNVLLYQNWQTKMHSQTVFLVVFLSVLLLNFFARVLADWFECVAHQPSQLRQIFFNPAAERDVSVSVKKQSKGNHMNKNTLLILCSTSGRISRKIFAMSTIILIPLKMDQRFSNKKHKNHQWIAPPTSLLHGITMRNRDFTENLSHMARSVKKNRDGRFL